MKILAQRHSWKPNLDEDIATGLKLLLFNMYPPCTPAIGRKPHARESFRKIILFVVDSHSTWLEVELMNSVTSEVQFEKLPEIFDVYGFPKPWHLLDNGPS